MEDLMSDVQDVELLVAPNAEVGIELIRSRVPTVVLMDINLPGMSGIEALAKLQALPETKDIPVVALSAAAMVGDAKRIQAAGFRHYLTKPVRVDELMRVLEELLA
jgi:CheY-like chemotaxis protein